MKIFLMFAAVLAVAGAMFVSAVPDCPDDTGGPTIYLPNPDDCFTFFVCSNGEAILRECPEGLMFNKDLETCSWPWDVPEPCGSGGNGGVGGDTPGGGTGGGKKDCPKVEEKGGMFIATVCNRKTNFIKLQIVGVYCGDDATTTCQFTNIK